MAIKFEKIEFCYHPRTPFEHLALKNVNASIENGDFVAVVGQTGSGKSTMVQLINALLLPQKGKVYVDNLTVTGNKKDVDFKNLRKHVGLLFQFPEYQLFEESVIKDVMFGPLNFGYDETAARNQSLRALEMVGIDKSLYEKSPLELSGGQKRRVAIAGVLSSDPDVIILDEPTSGLDPKGTKDIMAIFKELNEKYNKTIILICHDMNVVYEYANNVIAMKDGGVAYSGSCVDLFCNDQLLDYLSLAAPRVVSFANELKKKGFSTDPKFIRNMDDLVESIVKEMTL